MPFRHWQLEKLLPPVLIAAFRQMPAQALGGNEGRRATHNARRSFCTEASRAASPAWHALGHAFQQAPTLAALRALCGAALAGTSLRIELCVDTDGFWLEPHTDIGAKHLTLLIYLNNEPGSEAWGTDLLAPDGTLVHRMEARCNTALLFIPGADTWHGFAPRPILGERRCLIVNYVGAEWRAVEELAFPGEPVG